MPVWAMRAAMKMPASMSGTMQMRTQRSCGSLPWTFESRRKPARLRTIRSDMLRIAPDAVENDAATIPESTMTAMTGEAYSERNT